MRRPRFIGVRFIVFGIVFVGVVGLLTAGLWNALMPPIFGLPAIGYWQALGLLLLGRLLFGGLGGWPGSRTSSRGWPSYSRGNDSPPLFPKRRQFSRIVSARGYNLASV